MEKQSYSLDEIKEMNWSISFHMNTRIDKCKIKNMDKEDVIELLSIISENIVDEDTYLVIIYKNISITIDIVNNNLIISFVKNNVDELDLDLIVNYFTLLMSE